MANGFVRIELLCWWKYCHLNPVDTKKCKVIIKLLLGAHRLKTCTKHFDVVKTTPTCDWCSCGSTESVQHMLFECTGNQVSRLHYWKKVVGECPNGLLHEMSKMSSVEKTTFILTGFNNTFTKEWLKLYKSIANFVYIIYNERIHLPIHQ